MSDNTTGQRAVEVVSIEGDAEAFALILSRLFVAVEVAFADARDRVSAAVSRGSFGDMELLRTVLDEGWFTVSRTQESLAAQTSSSFFVSCVFAGTVQLTQAERLIKLRAGDIALLDSAEPYAVAIDGALDMLWIRIPRYRLEGRLPRPVEVTAQRVDGQRGVGRLVSLLLQATFDEADGVGPAHALRVCNVLLDLLTLSLSLPDEGAHRRSDTVLRRVQNYIEANLSDPELALQRIAAQHSISVRYLNKLFEREGISTARWIRLRRLERCRSDLEAEQMSEVSVSDIALSHGFGDVSSFNRAFKSHFGVVPGSLRPRRKSNG